MIRTLNHLGVFSVLFILVLAIRFPDMPVSSPTIILKKKSNSECSELCGKD